MFDLNLSTDFNSEDRFEANNSEGQSPETSVEDGKGESSSSNDHTCSRRASAGSGSSATLNVRNYRIGANDPDQGSCLVTRELFPVSRLDELNRGWRQNEPEDPPLNHRLHQPRMAVQQELQKVQQVQARKSRRGPRSQSSQYRGVTFYRRTGRWESHIWDCGKQVYLGGFDTALTAARAYDRAAIRFRGVDADINFNCSNYDDMKEMMNLSKEEFVHILRRQSNGFSRGSSKYRGVTLHKRGRWEAWMGQFLGKKAYDKAAANLEPSKYNGEMVSAPCKNEGSQHDLNLSLGISASPLEESRLLGSLQLHHDIQNSRTWKLHVGNSGLEGMPVTSEHPILCTAEKAWQMHGHVRVTQNATSANAASSGFSSLAIDCATPFQTGFSSHPNTTENASGCYSWIKPYLPPS